MSVICSVALNDSGLVNARSHASYASWYSMINRCYNSASLKNRPSYLDVSVCMGWLRYSNFKEWFYENHFDGFTLDKDILIPCSREYNPESCAFVTPRLNSTLKGMNSGDGILGVDFIEETGRYRSRLAIKMKTKHLGMFDNLVDAQRCWLSAKSKDIIDQIDEQKDERVKVKLIEYAGKIQKWDSSVKPASNILEIINGT